MVKTAAHYTQLFAPDTAADAALPERIQLIPAGTFRGRDGRGPYRVADAAALIAASQGDGPLIIDVGHATDKGKPEAPAYGRITALEADESGIWGRVTWNARGQAALREREYWGISPVFTHTEDGTVQQILRASLTNIPNLRLAALNSQENPDMNLLEQLRAALGLDATADEVKVVAHAKTLADAAKAAAETHTALCAALSLDPKADSAAVLTALQAVKAQQNPPEPKADAGLQAAHEALKKEVAQLKAEHVATEAASAVDKAIADRKAAPAEREVLVGMFAALGAEKFTAAMAVRPDILPAALGNPGQPTSGAEDPEALGLRAAVFRAAQASKGISLTATQAVMHCQGNPEAGK
jgi:phage I-like protein